MELLIPWPQSARRGVARNLSLAARLAALSFLATSIYGKTKVHPGCLTAGIPVSKGSDYSLHVDTYLYT